jgi:3-oxoacyl-[acyl-carrier protein] reductase
MSGTTASASVALVTGSSKGLGLAIARALAAGGHTVVVTGTRLANAGQAVDQLKGEGHAGVLALALDVADEASVAAAIGEIDRRFGRLDILVNNAGIAPRVNGRKSAVADTTLEDWHRTLETNLTGTFLVTRAAIPLMRRHQWGRIINIVSRAGRTRSRLASAHYAASKAGVIGFSRILADEVGGDGITVNCVSPTRITTPMSNTVADPGAIDREFIAETPLGRLGSPDDVSGVVTFLASPAAGFMTGAILDVTGGQFMP